MPAPLPASAERPASRRAAATAAPGGTGAVLPGLALCAVAVGVTVAVHQLLPVVSPLLVAILLGVLLTNTIGLPAVTQPGLAFASKRLLRLGVALLGLQLVLSDIVSLGVGLCLTVVAVVTLGIAGTCAAGRALGVAPGQRLLIACGFSICGAAAVAAADGVVDTEEEDVASAIALVVVFGTAMIAAVPLMATLLGLSTEQAGLWAGGSIHEVAQVVAVGGALGGSALAAAVVVKLARVLMLAPVLVLLGWQQRRTGGAGVTYPPLVPLFVLAFLAMVALRTTGVLDQPVIDAAQTTQTVLLSAAMFALGCSVRRSAMRKVGARPLALAAISTLIVALTALTGVLVST